MSNVTWDQLANIYDRETGGCARTKTMDSIFDWALTRTDLFRLNSDETLSLTNSGEHSDKDKGE